MDTTTFPHPVSAALDPNLSAMLLSLSAEGYGVYWRVRELLCASEDGRLKINKYTYEAISHQMNVLVARVEYFIDQFINEFELFSTDGDHFWHGADPAPATNIKKKSASRVSTIKPDTELIKKWAQTEQKLPATTKERWIEIKSFIDTNKPLFIEPYATAWNIFASAYKLPQIEAINDTRKKKFELRIKEEMFDFFAILDVIKKDDFYLGRQPGNTSTWKVTWDYLFENDMNFLKILERRK